MGVDVDEPTLLFTDSQSARDVACNPEHHDRMKHVLRRYFYVRDMVEKYQLEVPHIPTDDNLADFFTKPLGSKKFYFMRAKIMNEPNELGLIASGPFGSALRPLPASPGPRSEGGRPNARATGPAASSIGPLGPHGRT